MYEFDSGAVDFVDPTGIEPDLNITARTRVSGRDITLSISGVPDALSTSLQSDGGESESDIVSLLLTGRTVEEVGLAPEMAAADQALGLVSTEVLGTAGRSVGLDTLRVEQEVSTGQIRFGRESHRERNRPEHPTDGREESERPGAVDRLARPARKRTADLDRRVLAASKHRVAPSPG